MKKKICGTKGSRTVVSYAATSFKNFKENVGTAGLRAKFRAPGL
jgi:hypothetical protein